MIALMTALFILSRPYFLVLVYRLWFSIDEFQWKLAGQNGLKNTLAHNRLPLKDVTLLRAKVYAFQNRLSTLHDAGREIWFRHIKKNPAVRSRMENHASLIRLLLVPIEKHHQG
jgi:hypothetical protein